MTAYEKTSQEIKSGPYKPKTPCRVDVTQTHQVLRKAFVDFNDILGNVLHYRNQAVLSVAHVILQGRSL